MGRFSEEYYPVKQEIEDDRTPEGLTYIPVHQESLGARKRIVKVSIVLFFSILCNVLLGSFCWLLWSRNHNITHTIYADLTKDVPTQWRHKTEYTGTVENQTVADTLWDQISVNEGAIALTDAESGSLGLPTAQRFPWNDDMGIYFLNGYHNLHCLKKIRTAVREFHDGVPLSAPLHHVYHCLDAFRMEVLCDADDTPRYTGLDQENKASGTGQYRQCRDWDRMEAWAKTHSACWHYADEKDAPKNRLEMYRFCPKGSPYAEKVREKLGGLVM